METIVTVWPDTSVATPRPYKMIGKDGDAFVVCRPDKHGKNRTIAHIY